MHYPYELHDTHLVYPPVQALHFLSSTYQLVLQDLGTPVIGLHVSTCSFSEQGVHLPAFG